MMSKVIELLQIHSWNVGSEIIEIAKGKNELPKDFKGVISKNKRAWQSRKL